MNKVMIDDSKEYIIASAVWYNDYQKYPFQEVYGVMSGFVIAGFRHPYILSVVPSNPHCPDKECSLLKINGVHYTTEQGFITSHGRFVDRREAAKIAIDCGQCDEKSIRGVLYSEDVFMHQKNYAR